MRRRTPVLPTTTQMAGRQPRQDAPIPIVGYLAGRAVVEPALASG